MTGWTDVLAVSTSQHLTDTLLHTLWQGAVVAVLLGLALKLLPASRARLRYSLALIAQLTIVLGAVSTFAWLNRSDSSDNVVPTASVRVESGSNSETGLSDPQSSEARDVAVWSNSSTHASTTDESQSWRALIVVVWLVGFAVMLLRTALHVADAHRFARGAPATDPAILTMVDDLRRRLRIGRTIRVVISHAGHSPAVVGIFLPTLVLPVAALTGMPVEAVRAILVHELAHIRRYDYLWNIVQMLIESALFFNPAVWWISRQIRIEREACCDAMAMELFGQPIAYSTALADLAEQSRAAVLPAGALAASRSAPQHVLLDRIRRVLAPGHRPAIHISPSVFIGFVLASMVMLGGLWQGTEAAVALAAEVLSSTERIEQVSVAQEQYAPPAATSNEKVSLSGTVRTADGGPLPETIRTYHYTRSANSGISGTLEQIGETFSVQVPAGVTWLQLQPKGYAPAVAGPFNGNSGDHIKDIDVVLQRGSPVRVLVENEDGEPVENAKLSAGIVTGDGSTGFFLEGGKGGEFLIPNGLEGRYRFSASAPGYQKLSFEEMQVTTNTPVTLTLRAAVPASGVVVTPDGKPIAGAMIQQFTRQSVKSGNRSDGPWGEKLATTDAEGRFVLDQLDEKATYAVMVKSKEHGTRVFGGIEQGDDDLRFVVGPDLTVRGTLVGDLSSLPRSKGKATVKFQQEIKLSNEFSSFNSGDAQVEVIEGGGRFTLQGLLPGDLTVIAGEHQVKLKVVEREHEVRIDLSSPVAKQEQREIVVRFAVPEGESAPRGSVTVWATDPRERVFSQRPSVAIENGRASFRWPVGTSVRFEPEGVIGYWFKENSIKITAGEEPLEVTLQGVPAGALAGQVIDADGSPAVDGVYFNIKAIEKPTGLEHESVTSPYGGRRVDAEGRFFYTPLPLGGTYVAVASRGYNQSASQPVKLDASSAAGHASVHLPAPVAAGGQVVGPDGKGVAGIPLTLQLKDPLVGTSYMTPILTDHNGKFRFDGLNPTLGEYLAQFNAREVYQPFEVPLRRDGKPTLIALKKGEVLIGRVLDAATGAPIPGVELYAIPKERQPGELSWYEAEGKTDNGGNFRFSNLAPRPYTLNDRSGLTWDDRMTSDVVPGKSGPVIIRAKIPGGGR